MKSWTETSKNFVSRIPLLGRLVKADAPKQVEDNAALNDSDMRDMIMTLVRRSNINFNNIYLKPTESEMNENPDLETWDGLIMRPEGYFRVALEPTTGVKVILFEFEPLHLAGQRNPDGSIGLSALDQASSPYAPDVYRVAAFDPATDQAVLQEAISRFCRKLRNNVVPELDLYLRDETEYTGQGQGVKSHTFRAANQDIAFGIYKNDKNKWQSVMYSSMRGTHDRSGRFESIDELKRKEKPSRKIFRMNIDEMIESDDIGDVLKNTVRYFSINSHKRFKGQRSLNEPYKFKSIFKRKKLRDKWDYARGYSRQQCRKGVRALSGFIGSRYREYGMSAGVGLALSIKGFKFGAARAVLMGVGGAIGSTFIGKFIDEQTQKGIKTFFASRAEYKEMKAQLPQNRDYSRFFDSQQPENKDRPLKKISPALINRLVLLDHKASGMMNSMDRAFAVSRKDWKEQYLGGLETRMFGKANMALSPHSVLKIMPNGVLSLTHINDEFNIISKYYTYREEFVSSKAAPLHQGIRETLSKGVYKVTDDRGQAGLDGKQMRRCDFTKEIQKIFGDVSSIHGAPTNVPALLSQVFNPNAKGNPFGMVAQLLSEAANISHIKTEDSLDVLMNLSKELRSAHNGTNKAGQTSKGIKAVQSRLMKLGA